MVGEHIRTWKGGRWNHAIDCGDETVIHLAEGLSGAARVRRSYRPEFVSGAELVEVVTHRERTFPASEVVARAYSRISDPALGRMFRDSEAFAAWCATGRIPPGPPNVAASGGNAAPAGGAAGERVVNVPGPRSVPTGKAAAKRRRPSRATGRARKGRARSGSRASAGAKAGRARGAGKAGRRKATRRPARARTRRR